MEPLRRKVHYYETDCMNYVHNSNYLKIFEEARLDWMDKVGMPYVDMENEGFMIPVVNSYIDYLEPMHYADEFEVTLNVTELSPSKFRNSYVIRNLKTGKTAAEGYTTHCIVSKRTLMPVRIKKYYPELYSALEQDMAQNK